MSGPGGVRLGVSFRDRVRALADKYGLILTWSPLSPNAATITVRREGTPTHALTLRKVTHDWAESESGAILTPSDVIHSLRRKLEQRRIA